MYIYISNNNMVLVRRLSDGTYGFVSARDVFHAKLLRTLFRNDVNHITLADFYNPTPTLVVFSHYAEDARITEHLLNTATPDLDQCDWISKDALRRAANQWPDARVQLQPFFAQCVQHFEDFLLLRMEERRQSAAEAERQLALQTAERELALQTAERELALETAEREIWGVERLRLQEAMRRSSRLQAHDPLDRGHQPRPHP